MANTKKSFLLYTDLIHTVKHLSDDQKGKLFIHILEYVNGQEPETDDIITKLSFEPIKQSLKRDLLKWSDSSGARTEKARIAGVASAKARKLKSQLNSTNELSQVENELKPTKSTVSVSVSGSVSDSVSVSDNNIKLLVTRKTEFKNSLHQFKEFDSDVLKNFFEYWTEHGDNDKKMRFEKEKSFNTNLRLKRWTKNQWQTKQNSTQTFVKNR